MTETFYDVLDVTPDATQDDIKAAYRDKVKEYHPDVSDHDDAAERFKKVTRAEEVLGDETERARYDRLGHDSYLDSVQGANADSGEGSPWTAEDRDPRGDAGQRSGGDDGDGAGDGEGDPFGGWSGAGTGDASDPFGDDDPFWEAGGDGDGTERTNARQNARQRRRRQRRRAQAAGAGPGATGGARRRQHAAADATTGSESAEGSTFSIHDWDAEDLEPDSPSIQLSQESLFIVFSVFFLYPIFVFASVYPGFGLAVNLTVGVCTLVTMGWLLTMPTVAALVFGPWSVLAPVLLYEVTDMAFLSPVAMFALAAVWVPFGYALVLGRVLRS